ncbi:MAG: hypothetical protein NT154_30330, partial [Verrucomicrobia bacterium]|nr:hypothetical protein [Verrucomicrobiota bacterium]
MKTNSSLRWPKTLGAALAALWLLPASSPALILPVRECHQEQTQWCWAACSQSVLAFYGTNVSQGYIAWYGTGGMNIPNWLYGSTNELRGVDEILSYFGGIPTTGIPSYVPMEAARAEIATNGRPGIIEWTWSPGEGSHALVFHGLEGNMAYLMDPWYGPTINVYGWVVQGYTDIEGGHIWTGTLKLNSNPGTISVSPVTTSFGQIEIGNCVECPFVVSNAGPGTVCGSASVSPPFSVVSGSPYTNAAHQSRLVAARYCPVANETNSATVSFTGGGGAIRQVSGSGYSLVTVSGRITNQLDGVQMIEVPVTFWNGTNRWGVTTTDHTSPACDPATAD